MGDERGRIGIAASDLADDDLERELAHLHETRHETFMSGSADALKHHTDRMLELEAEYASRFPDRVTPDALRLRDTNRQAAGQDI
jgi:hypothetical protein